MSSIMLSHVSYTYRGAQTAAVKGASCTFEPGLLYAVVGPSGSGKSTLLSMLAGLDLPTEGEVTFDGRNLNDLDLDRYRRESIAMIFQAFQLFPLLTVLENVCYPMELCGVKPADARERAKILLERVGITKDKHNRFPSNLSGGEQQRVAIARSLSAGAKTLLADEPTGNLDVANTEKIMEILQGLSHNDGCCVIVVTHDQEVSGIADVVFTMKDGALMVQQTDKN
ncbi:MAG: ABC transporter ATP-binding protein [Clostridiales bacterium]|nr:ABC transporter ATP-binding protein [Clostridiales bacterium]